MVVSVPEIAWVEIVSLIPFLWRYLPEDEKNEVPMEVSKRRYQGSDRRGR